MVNLNPKNSSSLVSGSHTISILGSIFTPLAIVVVVVSGTVVVVSGTVVVVEEVEEVGVVTIVSSSTGADTGSADPPQKEIRSVKRINFFKFISILSKWVTNTNHIFF
jgi:hypothetical protein